MCLDSSGAVRIARRERATDLAQARLLVGPDEAVLQPMGAPEGAAAGHLALWRLLPGWPGGAGLMDGSGWVGAKSRPRTPSPPPRVEVWLGGMM